MVHMELADKIRAAIDESERIARAAQDKSPSPWKLDYYAAFMHGIRDGKGRALIPDEGLMESVNVRHIVRHDPAAVLRRCAADRKILDLHMPGVALTSVTDGATVTSCTSCGGWYTMKTGTEWPCDTVKALAGAYGIEP